MRSNREDVIAALLHARKAVKEAPNWRRYSQGNRHDFNPYLFCKRGWVETGYRAYFHDIPNALRPFTYDGDLTHWWHHGQSRKSMLGLFDQAIEVPDGMPAPVHSALWVRSNYQKKLSKEQVLEIVARLNLGEKQIPLAKEFGVSQSMVSLIRRGKVRYAA